MLRLTAAEHSALGVSIDAYSCSCVAGFTNGMCEYAFITEYTIDCAVTESSEMSDYMYSGNCDIDVNECMSSPCQNGAACLDSTNNTGMLYVADNAFRCLCLSGFTNGWCAYVFITPVHGQCTVEDGVGAWYGHSVDERHAGAVGARQAATVCVCTARRHSVCARHATVCVCTRHAAKVWVTARHSCVCTRHATVCAHGTPVCTRHASVHTQLLMRTFK